MILAAAAVLVVCALTVGALLGAVLAWRQIPHILATFTPEQHARLARQVAAERARTQT
jgi:ribose/xylose/arabinose/galactoside ABC-type transport system permease subunit